MQNSRILAWCWFFLVLTLLVGFLLVFFLRVTVVENPYLVGDFLAIVVYVVGFLEDCSSLYGALQNFKGIYRRRMLDI